MKIAFIINYSETPRGGVKSLKSLSESLSEEHDCKIFWRGAGSREFEKDTGLKQKFPFLRNNSPMELEDLISYNDLNFNKKLKSDLDKFEPDILVTQSAPSYFAVKYCQNRETKSVIFLRAWELLYENQHRGNMLISKIVNTLLRPLNKRIAQKTLKQADMTIANSDFTAEKYREAEAINSEVVYPFVDIEKYRVEEKGDKILHVNPGKVKGIELTLDVAEKMPEKEFILAGTTSDSEIEERIENLENVEKLGYLDDMKEAYRQTKIVLMPSKWEEPYGRIPIEAGASGIPTIATSKGGLPESVGNPELLIKEDPEEAVQKIKQVEQNYKKYSQKAKQNAEQKSMEKQVEKFQEIISDLN